MPDLELYRPRQLSRWQRFVDSLRSITLGPWNPKDPAIARYFGGGPTLSGISVNEASALAISAVWSAVTMISDDIASLPLMLYKRLPTGGKDRFEDHPLYRLLHDAPNPEMDSMVWRRTMQAHVLLWQNAYAEIERDGANRPVALWPIVPESVAPFRERGILRYRVTNPSGTQVILPAEDMIHLVGYSHDGSVGSSLVQQARESLGLSLAAEKYGAAYFGNGASVGGVVSLDGPMPDEKTRKGYREQLEARHQGVDRAHRFMVLYQGAKFTQNVIPPNAGQFNETRIQQIREVARWFKIPPHKLGDLADATYSNVEQMDAVYLSSCIRPWLVLWQQQLSRKLIRPLEQRQQFIEHNTHGFLSVDAASRAQLYNTESNIGTVTINEIRGYENRDPLAGGDRVFIQLNKWPLDRIDEWVDAELDAKKAQTAKLKEPTPSPIAPPNRDAEIETFKTDIALARRKAQEAEDAADRAKADQVSLRAELTREVEAHELTGKTLNEAIQQRDGLRAEVATLGEALRDEQLVVESFKPVVKELRADLEKAETARDEAQTLADTRHAALLEEQQAKANVETERDEARTARDEAGKFLTAEVARAQALEGLKRTAEDAGVLAQQEIVTLTASMQTVITERDILTAQLGVLTQERASEKDIAKATEAALTAKLDVAHAEVTAALADLAKLSASEQSVRTERDLFSQDIDTLQAQLRAAEQERQTERAAVTAQRRILMTSLRGVVVDTIERLLQREIDRARKNQTTPEKLRTWIGTFYSMHAETVRTSLRPVVTAWVALVGGEADLLLEKLVARHLDASQVALRSVAETEDPEQMSANLDRLLRRWESERAQTVADQWLKEGLQHG